ncbi:uncharacterized protein (TIGR02271 family) [Pseudonocardia sediminis]|uniref:Uncharacterized protein (TIGR02271 family) n=1 Tax=Pseudonocardia sediminis TaxID=1397368 RepID=A0A4Q7UV80_PSEST|nr:PRC and DUF2382 domain-containing protein [Pseudonocardia sediminis]RZT84944.1 uncharacterized protein (TIGR02271 family) [Pseudonocardia sediminis]
MTIANIEDPGALTGAQVRSNGGDKLGKVDSVYYDNDTDKPEWVAVKSGLFGTHVSLVPLQQGDWDGKELTVPFDKAALQNAPHHDPDSALSESDEQDLYRHYGMGADASSTGTSSTGTPSAGTDAGRSPVDAQGVAPTTGLAGTGETTDRGPGREPLPGGPNEAATDEARPGRFTDTGVQGSDTSGRTTGTTPGTTADDAMTRSEEQLRVGTTTREAGRARLRKHIVTENVSTTVPVSHDEVTLQREPITEADRGDAHSGADLTEDTHEVTLTAESAVVDKDVVPVERVRMGTETVTEQQQVDETVRKEVIDVESTDGVDTTGGRSTTTGKHAADDDRR